ncbi:MAG: peptidylprolyl isomerase [Candidatus Howiella sp.]|jgi:parvulin-like peptidyl-prolyl isomerase
MGKASRIKQEIAERRRTEAEKQQLLRKKKRRRRKIIALCAGILAAVILLSGGTAIGVRYYKESGAALRGTEVMSSENFSVDAAMMTYFFNETYQTYVSSNSSYLSYTGLDTTVSLKEQEYASGVTWFDYLMEQTQSQVREYLLFAEAARSAGMSLTDADQENIEANIETLDLASFGAGVKQEDVKGCLELSALAYKYYSSEYNAFDCTEDEIAAYYAANKTDFTTYDLLTYTLDYVQEDEAIEGDVTKATVDAYVERLKAASSVLDFENILTEYLSNEEGVDNDTIVDELAGIELAGTSYTAGDEVSEWAYEEGRAAWDTYIVDEGDGSVEVYKLTALPYRDESTTVDVRHILFSFNEYGSASGAKEAADRVYTEWQAGDATEDSFGELAATYSDDTGSSANGGLYEGVYEGQMVDSFNDWCFDDVRQPGDTGIVETDYGYHIMYFVGGGVEMWAADVRESLWNDQYDAILETLGENHTITIQSDKLNKVEPVTIDASSSSSASVSA